MGEGKGYKDDKGRHVFVLLSILVLIVGIVAAAGMVMAVLNYNNKDDKPINIMMERPESSGYQYVPSPPVVINGGGAGTCTTGGRKGDIGAGNLHYDSDIWTFTTLFDAPIRQIYANPITNQLAGYQVDVINEVCKIAGKNCAVVTGEFTDCFNNNNPQIALMGKWVDACMTFSHSAARARSVTFSRALSPAPVPVLLTRPGNPSHIDPDDLRGVEVGFLQNWWADEFCLSTVADIQVHEDQIHFYEEDEELSDIIHAVERGEIDAIFISDDLSNIASRSLEVVKRFDSCLLGGESIIMRKDSLLKSWWDPAFEKLLSSRVYRELCRDIDDPRVHGNLPGKPASEICFNH